MIVLVTGASSGIGEATARRLAREPDTHVVLVARREDRLRSLAAQLPRATVLPADLLDEDAPQQIADSVEREHGRLDLLVNNAGAAWRGSFAEGGWEDMRRHMALNFDAQVRLTEALLPLLRRSAPSAIVNVSSVSGRIARATSGAYSASKFALAGWSEALHMEEAAHGVHVGLVLPGFTRTEGFPQQELRDKAMTRWIVSTPDKVAEAIVDAGLNRKAERYVPRAYGVLPFLKAIAPGLVRRGSSSSAASPSTAAD